MATENYTIDDLMSWVNEGKFKVDLEILDRRTDSTCFRIYTEINCYSIMAKCIPGEKSYLGCIASSRKPRAGETWTRGNDLADGDLSKETWYNILADIVSYESVKIHKKRNSKSVMQTIVKDE